MSKIISIVNQKGGTGKTATSVNLAIGLANAGKKVLITDSDPQADATTSLGWYNQDKLEVTLATLMEAGIRGQPVDVKSAILSHSEGVDLLPGSIELSALEMSLVTAMSRERILNLKYSQPLLSPQGRGQIAQQTLPIPLHQTGEKQV